MGGLQQRLRARMAEKRVSQEKLAKVLGVTQSAIAQLLNDEKRDRSAYILDIAAFLGVNPWWLQDGKGPITSTGIVTSGVGKAVSLEYHGSKYVPVAVLDGTAGVGVDRAVDSQATQVDMWFRTDWLRGVTDAAHQKLRVHDVTGDAMEPTLRAGDQVLVDTTLISDFDDSIYVVIVDGTLMVKRLRWADRTRKRLTLISDNQIVRPRTVETGAVGVRGRVVWFGRRM